MEIVGDEFVVALELEIGDVEKNGAVFFSRALAQYFDGTAMAFQQRRQNSGYKRLLENVG